MENKEQYYYPCVEDIRIGWEGEVNWARGYVEIYDPEIVRLKDEDGTYLSDLEELTIAIDDGYAEARAHFLTKEQILAEGWVHEKDLVWKNENSFAFSWPNKIEDKTWGFKFYPDTQKIWIQFTVTDFGITVFSGSCPTVNEFRTLCKWLKIK